MMEIAYTTFGRKALVIGHVAAGLVAMKPASGAGSFFSMTILFLKGRKG